MIKLDQHLLVLCTAYGTGCAAR